MYKNIAVLILIIVSNPALCGNIYDASWCKKNGGTIEISNEYNINFNCVANEFNSPTYAKKIYNMLCIPLYSAITENRRPLFFKLVSDLEKGNNSPLDEFNFRAAQSELARFI